MKKPLVFLLAPVCLLLASPAHAAPSPEAILKAAEEIRNPSVDYQSKVTLVDDKRGAKETRTYETLIKGKSRALVRTLTPLVDKGTKILLVDNEMWIQMPSTAKPLRISPRQKLTGNAAYGDVIRLNFTGNYTAKFLKEDTYRNRRAYVLDLTAIEGHPVTYDRVEYWVDEKTMSPLRALYKTVSGKTLREGIFEGYAPVLGGRRPTHVVLVDFLQTSHKTTLVFSDSEKADLPDLLFEKQNFGRD